MTTETNSPENYPAFEMVHHFEQEAVRKSVELEQLWKLQQDDTTVATFLEAWRAGSFRSFEEMLCKLAVQLACEKAECVKTAVKQAQHAPLPSVIMNPDQYPAVDDLLTPGECNCEFTPYEFLTFETDENPDQESWHYKRRCQHCGTKWYGVHCPHDERQNRCPNCHQVPKPVSGT